jgi:hypothetical protein
MPLNIKSNFIRNCDESKSNVIKITENSSFYIDQNCNVISNVCAEYDGFKSASVIIFQEYKRVKISFIKLIFKIFKNIIIKIFKNYYSKLITFR